MSVPDRPKQDKDALLPKERLGGRFITSYDPEMALRILEKIVEGKTISEICKKGSGFCHPTTFKRWIVNVPELAKAFDAARKLSAYSFEEEALDTAREIKRAQRDGTQVRAYEVLIKQLQWSAERRNAAEFGTKAPVSIKVPIQINTTLDLGATASGGDTSAIYTIVAAHKKSPDDAVKDAEFTEVAEELVKGKPVNAKKPKASSHE